MATNLHRAFDNFNYQLGQISPTSTEGSVRSKFKSIDGSAVLAEEYPRGGRLFYVTWDNSDDDESPTDFYDRWTKHRFTVNVFYTIDMNWDTAHRLILQDRHDINKQLRDPTNFVGYNSSNTSTDVGIKTRIRISDQIVREESAWVLLSEWECMIQEVEQ